jgi:translin
VNTKGLAETAEKIRAHFDAKHAAREPALRLSREVVRLSANAIRAVHRSDFETAEERIGHASEKLSAACEGLADHQDIFNAGFVHDAAKEYAEASLTLAIIAGRPLPTPEDLNISAAAYLNGLGETVGELRRHLLDSLRRGDIKHCEESLASMDDIYDILVTMDYPEAVTAGLRRNTDAVRGILERTRGDFTNAFVQRQLENKLEDLGKRLGD